LALSLLLYAGLAAAAAGGIWSLLPRRLRGGRPRRIGLGLLAAGLTATLLVWWLPPPAERHAPGDTLHDAFAPVYEFYEVHAIEVAASRESVDAAIRGVTAGEVFLFRTLTGLRRMGRPGPEDILNVPEHRPILEVATSTTFLTLADVRGEEIVVGTLVMTPPGFRVPERPTPDWYRGLDEPGLARATMSFLVEEPSPGLCRVTTETRVHTTDARSRRIFARYWRAIYPGSAWIRREWLKAIRRRAESSTPPVPRCADPGRHETPGSRTAPGSFSS
jgi:hypothetical protein